MGEVGGKRKLEKKVWFIHELRIYSVEQVYKKGCPPLSNIGPSKFEHSSKRSSNFQPKPNQIIFTMASRQTIILSLIVAFVALLGQAQAAPPKKECEEMRKKMDACGQRAMILTDPEFRPPKSESQMNEMCQ